MRKHRLFAILIFVPMLIFSSCTTDKRLNIKVSDTKEQTDNIKISDIYPNQPVQSLNIDNSQKEPQDKIQKDTPSITPEPVTTQAKPSIYKRGDKGNEIKIIQQKLNKFDYKLIVDGDFGNSTYNAVIDFQKRNKVSINGIVDAKTLEKLNLKPTSATTYKPPVNSTSPNAPVDTKSKEGIETFINGKDLPSSTNYFIWIDLKKQKVNVFTGSNHNWKLLKSMVCSSGKASTPTIKGNFKIGNKGTYFTTSYNVGSKTMSARCKYFTQISGNYLFHSVIYDKAGEKIIDGSLGVPRSHGCVRLAVENAKFIYDTIPRGTAILSN